MNQLITFDPQAIKQLDGLYCLNDLHRLAGEEKRHQPALFMRKGHTKALIAEIERSTKSQNAYKVIQGGDVQQVEQGTYACRELVYAYAMWIDPAFYLAVIRVFDRVMIGATSYTAQINALCSDLNRITDCLSELGRGLAVHGKQTKPRMIEALNHLLEIQQPQLPLGGEH